MLLFQFEIRKLRYLGTGIFGMVVVCLLVCYYDKMAEEKTLKTQERFCFDKDSGGVLHGHWLHCFWGCGEVGYHCLRS